MRIVDLRTTPVAIADPPLRSSYGRHAPYALRTVIELVSEDGLVGLSEAHGGDQPLADFELARPAVLGRDARRMAGLLPDLDERLGGPPGGDRSQTYVLPGESRLDVPLRVYAALEVAALDLVGHAVGLSVADLLGGRVRDSVPFSAYLFYKHAGGGGEGADARPDEYGEALTAEGIVAQARAMIARYGFASVKLKAGVLAPDQEIAAIRALREALGQSIPLRIDPNAAWSVATSLRVGEALAGSLEYLEDPAPGLDGLAQVRRGLLAKGIDMPIASNVAVSAFADLPAAVRLGGVQVVLGDHHYWGGARAMTHLGAACEAFGLGLSMHSNSHLGISLLAMTHVAAATPHLTYACDTHYPWQDPADEVIEGGKVAIRDGSVRVPDGPGLGAVLDRDALARGRERYQRCEYRRRDDTAEMRRHVDPGWRRVVPAW